MGAGLQVGNDSEGLEQDTLHVRRVPFQLGAPLVVRSLANLAHKAETKVVGVLENDFILVKEPVFDINERLSASVGGALLCSYFHDGALYKFRTAFRNVSLKNVVCMDYPEFFEGRQLRRFPRVKVNLEVAVKMGSQTLNADIRDISEGGCCVELPSLIPVVKGAGMQLTFILPDNQSVESVQCAVMNTRYSYAHRKTAVGLCFSAPDREVAKVRQFCQMCMYFQV